MHFSAASQPRSDGYFKLCRKVNGLYYSMLEGPTSIQYNPDEQTIPPFGRLFVFQGLDNALNANPGGNYSVFDCDVESPEDCHTVVLSMNKSELLDYWQYKPKYMLNGFPLVISPVGTKTVSSVILRNLIYEPLDKGDS